MEGSTNTADAVERTIDEAREELLDLCEAFEPQAAGAVDVLLDEIDRLRSRIMEMEKGLKPFAAVSAAYYASELDEHRPEWGRKHPEDVEVLAGRGGRRLLTLADFHAAARLLTEGAK